MDVPLKWLAQYVDWEMTVEELAHRLSMAGAEVEAIKRSGSEWEHVVVGRVAAVEQHPNADRLLTSGQTSRCRWFAARRTWPRVRRLPSRRSART
ncbi:MAG: hypothetical protein OXG42_08850 [Chloroflexi bacterium]|nr:hypothetical protein [Chloroflexota bacterium]